MDNPFHYFKVRKDSLKMLSTGDQAIVEFPVSF